MFWLLRRKTQRVLFHWTRWIIFKVFSRARSAMDVMQQENVTYSAHNFTSSPDSPQSFLFTSRYDSLSPSCWAYNYDVCVNELITLALPLYTLWINSRAPSAPYWQLTGVARRVTKGAARSPRCEWVCVVIFIHVCRGSGRATRNISRNAEWVGICNCRLVNTVVQ